MFLVDSLSGFCSSAFSPRCIAPYALCWLTVSSAASIFSEWLWLIAISPLMLFPWPRMMVIQVSPLMLFPCLGWVRGRLFLLCLLSRWFLHAVLVQALVLRHASAGFSSCATIVTVQALVLRHACAGSSCCISCHDACASVLNRVRTLWYSDITQACCTSCHDACASVLNWVRTLWYSDITQACCISCHDACASILNRVRTLWYSDITQACCISCHDACASILNRVRTLWYSDITQACCTIHCKHCLPHSCCICMQPHRASAWRSGSVPAHNLRGEVPRSRTEVPSIVRRRRHVSISDVYSPNFF